MNYIVSGTTDIGLTKKTNQDSFNVRVFTCGQKKAAFAILCDGMGGLSKGEVASASVVNAFKKWSEEKLPSLLSSGIDESAIRSDWSNLAIEFNEKIKLYGAKIGSAVGTTLSAILLADDKYYIINVGDTRVYEIFDRVGLLTKDHSVVAREIELGNLTHEQAKNDPRRSVLLQCIGASDAVYPDIFIGNSKKDAVYMLCSDGFRHEILEDEIYAYLNPNVMCDDVSMKTNMTSLIELNKQRNERDNITVVTIRTF